MWSLIIKNKQQLDKKEKMQTDVILVFFSKKILFQRHKSY